MSETVLVLDPSTSEIGWALGFWDDNVGDVGGLHFLGRGVAVRPPGRPEGIDNATWMALSFYDTLQDAAMNGEADVLVWEGVFSPNRTGMETMNQLIGSLKIDAARFGLRFGKPLNPSTVDRLCQVPYPRGLKGGKRSEARKRGLRKTATTLLNVSLKVTVPNFDAMGDEEFERETVPEHMADAMVMAEAYFRRKQEEDGD